MAININLYRQRIGSFVQRGPKSKKLKDLSWTNKCEKNSVNLFLIVSLVLMWTSFLCATNGKNHYKESYGNTFSKPNWSVYDSSRASIYFPATKPLSHIPIELRETVLFLLIHFCYHVNINKIMKIINGNRKERKGINIMQWNCERGLITKSRDKIDEVKSHLQNYNPHIYAVTECNIPYERSLSENLLDRDPDLIDYQIPGYNIILPKSWSIGHK